MTARSSIEGIDWFAGAAALRLENGRVSGTAGINRVMGDYRLDGPNLAFGPLATTMMAGPPEQMERERTFLAELARVEGWSVDGDQLVLRDSNGVELVRLGQSHPAKETDMQFIHTCYRITDPERSTAFYEALGLEKRRELPIRDEAMNYFFGVHGHETPELELTHNFGVDSYELGTAYGHIALTVENMSQTLERLAAQGIEPERPPYSVREGGSLLCFVRDPDQYRIELIERSDY
jgi:lactoylglutathione lyase